jgi:hypothetical protein
MIDMWVMVEVDTAELAHNYSLLVQSLELCMCFQQLVELGTLTKL